MTNLSVPPPHGINVSAATGGSGNEIDALMKRIAQLQKQIKKLIEDNSGDPKQKAEQLTLMQSELVLQNQALARLLHRQAMQGKNQHQASGPAETSESAPEPASATPALHAPAVASVKQTQQGQASSQEGPAAPNVDTYV
ncbi:hypothetical protein [Undibacterium sp.]|jgi:hypothetical protein|uniref:hypothetical protein n=1 Tax=Undibacterium sp. TaxID=1914977 RepID=UPI002BB93977|nr:hypothetical protein [Undibacterium sp.]HTD06675.1 hypothetical protein [Undibacterium sp.]